MKSQKKPGFRSSTPDNKGGQVPPESSIKQEVIHSIPFAGHPCSNKDDGTISYGDADHPDPIFGGQQAAEPETKEHGINKEEECI
jgi:hypothetical protein